MGPAYPGSDQHEQAVPDDEIGREIRSIRDEFSVALGSAGRVAAALRRIDPAARRDPTVLLPLSDLLDRRDRALVRPIFEALEDAARLAEDPWPFVLAMLSCPHADMLERALDAFLLLARERRAPLAAAGSEERLARLARLVLAPNAALARPEPLGRLAAGLRDLLGGPGDPIPRLYGEAGDGAVRGMAAAILDLEGPPGPELRRHVLDPETEAALGSYFEFTRIGHREALSLAAMPAFLPAWRAAILRAEACCGERLLRDIICEIGWDGLRDGLQIEERIEVAIGSCHPVLVAPAEAALFDRIPETRRQGRWFFARARGGGAPRVPAAARGGGPGSDAGAGGSAAGSPGGDGPTDGAATPMGLFRAATMLHAEALRGFLDLKPLSRDRASALLDLLDRIVESHRVLFLAYDEECRELAAMYASLKERILESIRAAGTPDGPDDLLPPEPTRLVQMFEDARSLAEVTTLHGLKRYLHQRGLRFAFRLVEGARGTDSTVTLGLASPERVVKVVRCLSYVDFEPELQDEGAGMPPLLPACVRIASDGIERQLLGSQDLPDVKLFCFGNEVHGYINYGSHPAFVRIDLSPPSSGGMIDLEYYGVSKVQADQHPAPDLPAIQRFFRRLDYDVTVERTRLHARYDKEHALDLDDLTLRVAAFFRLLPYLMDIDWVLGSLELSPSARELAGAAWAEFFHAWGFLPLERILTRDRLGILTAVATGAAGEPEERRWNGEGPYRDAIAGRLPDDLHARVVEALAAAGLTGALPAAGTRARIDGQIALERFCLDGVRDAVERGEIEAQDGTLRAAPADRFARVHECLRFADLLEGPREHIATAARMASVIAAVERSVRFETTATLNGHPVQCGGVASPRGALGFFVLRDRSGIARLGLAARGRVIHRTRATSGGAWTENLIGDPEQVLAELRRDRYLTMGPSETAALLDLPVTPEDLIEELRRPIEDDGVPGGAPSGSPGPAIVSGRKVAPGRARGIVLFETRGREPADLRGAILASQTLRPEEGAHLREAAGLLTTGGGILSHAGLLAVQYAKPSLILHGAWTRGEGPAAAGLELAYEEYEAEALDHRGWRIVLRRRRRERTCVLRERDLVVLDADEGIVQIFGRDADALTLHQELNALAAAGEALAGSDAEREILDLRGRRLRAIHQIEKVLRRTTDPAFARFALREILSAETGMAEASDASRILRILLENSSAGAVVRAEIRRILDRGARSLRIRCGELERALPGWSAPYPILGARLDLVRRRARLAALVRILRAAGQPIDARWDVDLRALEESARARLEAILRSHLAELPALADPATARPHPLLRHRIRQIERLSPLVALPGGAGTAVIAAARRVLEHADAAALDAAGARTILHPADGGLEILDAVGGKAANLAEMVRQVGPGIVPAWFVVGETALRRALESPGPGIAAPMGAAIEEILSHPDSSDGQKAFLAHKLWRAAEVPTGVSEAIREAYAGLAQPGDDGSPWVAVRSSGRDEDVEDAFRAGEFDSFLFVRDPESVIEHVRLVWAGLWTARAIARRRAQGIDPMEAGGGVIVQRIVRSRASGVLQTVNIAEDRPDQMVVSAGLGLGEGIVSGTVGADHLVIGKESVGGGRLRLRATISEKMEKVVFDARRGRGTARVPTLYHERQRAALEYVEIFELARAALALEDAYGVPLDIEFAFEGSRLHLLQARPVVTYASVLRATRERFPIGKGEGESDP